MGEPSWTISTQAGLYQYYIHGSGPVTDYSRSRSTPLPCRTELISQTTANLGTRRLYYHFSMKKSGTNPPNPNYEHQVNFFESHFTVDETISTSPPALSPLWHSTESSPLTQVVAPISASTSTNSADWHLGVLRLPGRTNDPAAEDWYFSGVYVESGSLTTAIGNGSVSPPVSSSTLTSTTRLPTSTSTSTSSTKTSTTSVPTPTSAAAQKYGQCSGNGWTSATQCVVDHDLHVLE
ncbi:hypothetical protein EV426DRAFT_631617 [Tirmania nivea]|nr:hypothetical protein EV426DRAFT_631617 [Tirmania nivea]